MVRKIDQKWGIIQIRTLLKNGGIVQIGGKCLENKKNSKWGILQKMWGPLTISLNDTKFLDYVRVRYGAQKYTNDSLLNYLFSKLVAGRQQSTRTLCLPAEIGN